jgi:nicotinamidase-related amidase
MTTAVLVIDVQQVFREGEHQAHDIEGVIERINAVTSEARSRCLPVIFVQHEAATGPLTRQSPSWRLADGLNVLPSDRLVHKKGSDSFHGTELERLARELGIREFVVCGIQSDFCVDSTVRRALALSFNVRLVEDAHTTLSNGVLSAAQISAHHTHTLCNLTSYAGRATACAAHSVFDST